MVEIKELKTMDELAMVQEMEERVWGMPPIPTHQTFTAVKNGGIMLGAFEGGEMIGFSYGFAGFRDGESYLCSHMLGIDAAYRSKKIGERLKKRQREIAVEKGYSLMQWTFDPLETRNAYLNLTKLKAICNTYVENCYGEMKDGINKGLPSDRFEVHWHLDSAHVTEQQSFDEEGAVPLNDIRENSAGLLEFVEVESGDLDAQVYTLSVPKNFQQLKAEDPDLALEWRMKTREKFQSLFAAGYSAVRLNHHEASAEYIFVKTNVLNLGGEK